MKKWGIAFIATLCVAAALAAACGGGGDDDNNGEETTTSGTRTATRTGTPGADGTGTPGADETAGATDATVLPDGTVTNAEGTPLPNATPAPGQTAPAGATPTNPGATPGAVAPGTPPTPSDAEREVSGEVDEEITGGNPNDPPEVVTDLPPVPPGATIDPPTIAPPNATAAGIEFIIDANASEPGIQTSRSVKVGDVFRVGVVATNIPPAGATGGLSAFGFEMLYDITRIVAPTIEGGSSLGRNPDFNEGGLMGGGAAGWNCLLPAPVGDADEPGSFEGDGDPATGQAIIGCFTNGEEPEQGTLVLATVQFQAVATGSVTLNIADSDQTGLWDVTFEPIGDCGQFPPVPCRSASISVTN